jgi:hypothetical protein
MAMGEATALPIPLIDMTQDSERHIFVARGTEELYHCGPTTALMPDQKTMLCVWTYEHGGRCGPMKKSLDGGLSWSELLPVPDNWRSVQNDPTIYRLVDPAGKARLVVFAGRWAPQQYAGPENTMHQSHSEDDGETWTPMVSNGLECVMPFCSIEPIDGGARLLGMSNIRRDEDPNNRQPLTPDGHVGNRISQSYSEDGGLTWSPWRVVLDIPPNIPGEPELVRSPDGTQLLCLIRDNVGRWETTGHSLYMTSDDEGATWSEPRQLPLGLTGDRHRHRFSGDGRLLVSMRNTAPGCPERGDLVVWVGTYNDIINGREGQYRIRLLKSHAGSDAAYSAIELLPDGTFVVTAYVKYRPGAEKHSIVSVRFTLAEIDAKVGDMRVMQGPVRV